MKNGKQEKNKTDYSYLNSLADLKRQAAAVFKPPLKRLFPPLSDRSPVRKPLGAGVGRSAYTYACLQ